MTSTVRIACCQFAPAVGQAEDNAARTVELIGAAAEGGAQIVLLPELCNSGYVFESEREARDAAVPADGPLLSAWAQEAARSGATVVGGFCEQGADGTLHNSSALVTGDGVLAVYRKLHLWHDERRWFTPGDTPAPVVDTPHGRIGLAVCYDVEFPELTRGLALDGADLIAIPTNWPRSSRRLGSGPVLATLAAVTAYFSRVFVAICDRCGDERGLQFEGGSAIAGPDGGLRRPPRPGHDEGILFADCDLAEAGEKANGARNDVLLDRRPDAYSARLTQAG